MTRQAFTRITTGCLRILDTPNMTMTQPAGCAGRVILQVCVGADLCILIDKLNTAVRWSAG